MKRVSLALAMLLSTATLPAAAADLVLYDALDFSATVVKAFTAKTGVTVDVVEPGSTGETLGKIAAEGTNPQFDLVWLDGSAVFERMLQDKVLQPVPDAVQPSTRVSMPAASSGFRYSTAVMRVTR